MHIFFSMFKVLSSVNNIYIQPLRGILHSWMFWSLQIVQLNFTNHKLNKVEILTCSFQIVLLPVFHFHPLQEMSLFSPQLWLIWRLEKHCLQGHFLCSLPNHKLPPSCTAFCLYLKLKSSCNGIFHLLPSTYKKLK